MYFDRDGVKKFFDDLDKWNHFNKNERDPLWVTNATNMDDPIFDEYKNDQYVIDLPHHTPYVSQEYLIKMGVVGIYKAPEKVNFINK